MTLMALSQPATDYVAEDESRRGAMFKDSSSLQTQAFAVIAAFCQRCEIPYQSVTPSPDFLQACEDDIKRRLTAATGTPPSSEYLEELHGWTMVGAITGAAYSHLPENDAVFTSSYTILMSCLDDVCENDVRVAEDFMSKFMSNQLHGHPIVDALSSLLRETTFMWEPVQANQIVLATLNFIESLLHVDKMRGVQVPL